MNGALLLLFFALQLEASEISYTIGQHLTGNIQVVAVHEEKGKGPKFFKDFKSLTFTQEEKEFLFRLDSFSQEVKRNSICAFPSREAYCINTQDRYQFEQLCRAKKVNFSVQPYRPTDWMYGCCCVGMGCFGCFGCGSSMAMHIVPMSPFLKMILLLSSGAGAGACLLGIAGKQCYERCCAEQDILLYKVIRA